jgi:hypothetical protein
MNAFKRFGLLVAPSAILSFICFIQLFDPSVFGEKHPALCWIGGIVFGGVAVWQFIVVAKNSNTGSQR